MNSLFETDIKRGAEFSPCRTWRYALWREWGFDGKFVALLGLNPSTADEAIDDPTIKRCIRFAKDWGYDGLLMLNAYGFRATKPRVMKAATDPNGPGNDEAILIRIAQAELVVAAWGVHCEATRSQALLQLIGRTVHCLGKTKGGHPTHPLYIKADTKPEVFWEPSE